MAAKPKKGGLTIGILLGKDKPGMGSDPMASDKPMEDMEDGEEEGQGQGLPLGFAEAVAEMRAAADDDAAAQALYNAIKLAME